MDPAEDLTIADKTVKVKQAMEEYKALDHEDMVRCTSLTVFYTDFIDWRSSYTLQVYSLGTYFPWTESGRDPPRDRCGVECPCASEDACDLPTWLGHGGKRDGQEGPGSEGRTAPETVG